jgi:lipoate-protein ligase A
MAVDETLLEAAANEGQCTLRFYQWAEPTLSLGYFQAYADRARHEASRRSAVVRRTSGGGAILHDFDVTYSLAVPEGHPLAVNRLRTYRVVHDALIEVLAGMGIEAWLFDPDAAETGGNGGAGRRPSDSPSPGQRPGIVEASELVQSAQRANTSPNGWPVGPTSEKGRSGDPGRCPGLGEQGSCGAVEQPSSCPTEGRQCNCQPNQGLGEQSPCGAGKEPFLCFQRRAPGDVVVKGEKIAGSAQRRCRGAVLQHGSVLLARSPAAPELDGLKELTARTILVNEFIQAWSEKLYLVLAVRWQPGSLSERQRRRAAELVKEKYASAVWTNAR